MSTDCWVTIYPVARGFHRCQECRCSIEPGTQYVRHSGIEEGEPFSIKVCKRCATMRSEAWTVFDWWDGAPSYGELRNELKSEWGVADPEAWLDERLCLKRVLGDALQAVADYQGVSHEGI